MPKLEVRRRRNGEQFIERGNGTGGGKAFLRMALSKKTSCAILQVDGGNIAAL